MQMCKWQVNITLKSKTIIYYKYTEHTDLYILEVNTLLRNLTTALPKSSTSNVKTPAKYHIVIDIAKVHKHNALTT